VIVLCLFAGRPWCHCVLELLLGGGLVRDSNVSLFAHNNEVAGWLVMSMNHTIECIIKLATVQVLVLQYAILRY
jgi:hypothetical protein